MKPTILVVDNEEGIRKMLQAALAREYNLITAGDGFHGLSEVMVGEQRIDLVIADLKMPGLDGIEFIEELPEPIPFIVISGYLQLPEFRQRLERLHPVAVFKKPFHLAKLRKVIQQALA